MQDIVLPVLLRRMATSSVADKKRMFDCFTDLRTAAKGSHLASVRPSLDTQRPPPRTTNGRVPDQRSYHHPSRLKGWVISKLCCHFNRNLPINGLSMLTAAA